MGPPPGPSLLMDWPQLPAASAPIAVGPFKLWRQRRRPGEVVSSSGWRGRRLLGVGAVEEFGKLWAVVDRGHAGAQKLLRQKDGGRARARGPGGSEQKAR